MARAPDTGDTFVREVDDAYRADRVGQFWRRYARWLFVGIGALLIGAAALLYWQNQRRERADARGQVFAAALGDVAAGRSPAAAPKLAELTDAPEPGYRALARLARANVAARGADATPAVAELEALIADEGAAQPFRDLALLRLVMLRFDALPPATVAQRLAPLARPGNAWFGSAAELTALAHLRDGKPGLARPLLAAIIADPNVPVSIRARVQPLLSAIPAAAARPAR